MLLVTQKYIVNIYIGDLENKYYEYLFSKIIIIMNIYFILLIFIIICVIYVLQNKDIITKLNQQLLLTTVTPNTVTQPKDCIGYYENTGTCVIDSCDPSQNRVGLGKQTQKFIVHKYSENEGKPCHEPTREIDCSLNNYVDCVQCGGLEGNYTEGTCTNFKSCKGIIGIGEREDTWFADALTSKKNCIMKPNRIVPCEMYWKGCQCSYDISDSKFCNENNIFCEGDTGVCTSNYIKTNELPGGICPEPNNIIRNPDDPLCTCRVERSYGPWTLGRCDVDGTGTRTRTITITKIGGNKKCKIRPEPNEQLLENTAGVLNVGGYFQFNPDVDVPGGTFQTVQIENNVNNICPVDCSGNWGDWSDCAVTCDGINASRTGTRTRTYKITTFPRLNGNPCPKANNEIETINDSICTKTDCPIDCSGNWGDWSVCSAITGQRTRTVNRTINPLNGGRICPVPQTENCTIQPPITNISPGIIPENIRDSTDKFMIFKTGTSSSFTVRNEGIICDILMIGGGGAGGDFGGGGAGACIVAIGHTLPGGVCNVTVGKGGISIVNPGGGDSLIYVDGIILYRAKGGGSGGQNTNDGNPGGCGGGAGAGYTSKRSGGTAVNSNIVNGEPTIGPTIPIKPTYAVFGNKGGDQEDNSRNNSTYSCAGGGGIGAAGGNHASGVLAAGPGGAGLNEATINGITYNFKKYFANDTTFGFDNYVNDGNSYIGCIGGGGSGVAYYNLDQAQGGIGGGGRGAANIMGSKIVATSGATNTGSGGGGGGGYGGSGIVIIRYRS